MKRTMLLLLFFAITYLLFSSCSNIDYSHPLDTKGTYDHPEDFLDADGDGTLNLWDPDHERYQSFKDDTKPVITLLGDDTIRVPINDPNDSIGFYANYYEVSDDKDSEVKKGNKDRVLVTRDFPLGNEGTFPIVYKAWDNAGNETIKTRYVVIYKKDSDPPRISFATGETVYTTVGSEFNKMNGVTAFDEIDKNLTDKIEVTGALDINKPGTYTLIYKVKDKAGNLATKERRVIVTENGGTVDQDLPVITLVGSKNMVIDHGQAYVEPGYDATDLSDGNLKANVKITYSPQPFDASKPAPGIYTINYSVTDKSGNFAAEFRILTVRGGGSTEDNVAPVIKLLNPKDSITTIAIGSTWKMPAVKVEDNVDNISSNAVKYTNPPNTATPGTYVVTLYVADAAGNTGKKQITVIVADIPRDVTPPVITILGKNPDTCGTGSTYTDKGATAKDSVDGVVTAKITTTNQVDATKAGNYKIIYEVTDVSGNTAKAERIVVVKDDYIVALLVKYGVPTETPLPSLNSKSFSEKVIDGTGPNLSRINKFKISWNLESAQRNPSQGLYDFAFEYDGAPYHKSFSTSLIKNFHTTKPQLTISGTDIIGMDGEYYVKVDGTDFIWVKTDGSFAIIWKP